MLDGSERNQHRKDQMINLCNVIIQFTLCALNAAFAGQGGQSAWLSWAAAVFLFGMGLHAIVIAVTCRDR
jgi:hypothetical protein